MKKIITAIQFGSAFELPGLELIGITSAVTKNKIEDVVHYYHVIDQVGDLGVYGTDKYWFKFEEEIVEE